MKIAILGPPGSGKGVQADLISKRYKLKNLSAGRILREEGRRGTKLGKYISKIIDKGNLAPSELVIDLMKKNIPKNNFILDAFPRKMDEIKWTEKHHPLEIVMNLNVKKKTIIERLSKRKGCIGCGKIFNLNNKKSCDGCGGKLYVREDDKPPIIRKRIKIYEKDSLPVVKLYEKMGKVININGEGTIKEVSKRIFKVLDKFYKQKKK